MDRRRAGLSVGRTSPRPVERPFFIVGSPRSGTTLLRMMLDGHPRLAIPDESHFIVGLAPRPWSPTRRRRAAAPLDAILRHPRLARWDVDPAALASAARARPHDTYAEAVDAAFSAYATLRGKHRWGDKTPGYGTHLPLLARLFADAQFVHIIRDGREVAASLEEWSWGPPSAVSGAFWWVHKVRAGRRAGRRLGPSRYYELHLESLVATPREVLIEVCGFLGEEFAPAMLDYPDRVAASLEPGPEQERHLTRPPTAGLRDWRTGLSVRQREAVDEVCRRTLGAFGYDAPSPRRRAWAYAVAVRLADLVRTGPSAIRARLSPGTREF